MKNLTRLVLLSGLSLVAASAVITPSRAAPPGPPGPAGATPKVDVPKVDVRAPFRITNVRRAESTPYVSGALGLQIEVENTTGAEIRAPLVVGGAQVEAVVAPNARRWMGIADADGLQNGCKTKTLPAKLGDRPPVTIAIEPTCTFDLQSFSSENQSTDDSLDATRRGKLWTTIGPYNRERIRCGTAIMGSVRFVNNSTAVANDVHLMFEGNRANVGTIQPNASSTGNYVAVFDGRHGNFSIVANASKGVPTFFPVMAIQSKRSCTPVVSLQ